jgi:hypothetical protein
MQLDPPAQAGDARRRLRGLLVWCGLTLLAAVALALAMVIASLALQLGSGPAPSPTSSIRFSPPGGHSTRLTTSLERPDRRASGAPAGATEV